MLKDQKKEIFVKIVEAFHPGSPYKKPSSSISLKEGYLVRTKGLEPSQGCPH